MAIDTTRTIEIEGSPWKMLGLGVLGVGMTALCGAIALHWIPTAPGSLEELAGWAGLIFFGLMTLLIFWRALTSIGPVVTITPDGIRDSRVAAEIVPWTAVRGISTWSSSGQQVMVLAVEPDVEAGLTLTRIAKWSRGPNKSLGADGLCVTAQGLKTSYDELLATSTAYAEAAWARAGATAGTSGVG